LVDGLRGPRSIWLRATSNAIVKIDDKTYNGFVMQTGTKFTTSYGVTEGGALLGHDSAGTPLYSNDEERFRPGPGIDSMTVGFSGGYGTIKRGTLKWSCWSRNQLEILENFFMVPGSTLLVEWGWSNIPGSIVFPIKEIGTAANEDGTGGFGLLGAWTNRGVIDEKVKDAKGSYDAMIGMITNFEWSMNSEGGYDCTTQITTPGETYLHLRNDGVHSRIQEAEISGPKTFKDFFINNFDRILSDEDHSDKIWKHIPKQVTSDNKEHRQTPREGERERARPEMQDWTFITWGYLEEIINDFYNEVFGASSGGQSTLFKIKSDGNKISAHPNMISTNGDVLIIPNPNAPAYEDDKIQTKNLSINGIAFPPNMTAGDDNYSGELSNLFINVDAIKDSLYREPLFWNFQIRSRTDDENTIEIVDLNYTETPVVDFVGNATDDVRAGPQSDDDQIPIPFLFKVNKATGILTDVSVESDLPSETISTIVYSRADKLNERIKGGRKDIMGKLYDIQGDRLLMETIASADITDPRKTSEDEAKAEIDPLSYWWVWDQTTQDVKSYVYPFQDVVNSNYYQDEAHPRNNRNNNVLIPINGNITLNGISGIRIGDCFMIDELPKRYYERGVFHVMDIQHDISTNGWSTRIEGQFRVINVEEKDE